ncbi:hypothetical protein [uncultured Acinetobacter sp.]|uniref:hypothetical protein n=1 Tax=uncultured Acinetobacter sp. TaxID=165433 RepID=UPI0037489244
MKISQRIKNNPLASLIIFVLLLWSTYPLVLKLVLGKNDWSSLGTFGDTYGALNTLFSGLAFAVLILSLFLQRKELEAQRIELEAQRLEIKESNLIAEAQRKITEQQATLIEQQIKDANVQSFNQLLFQYLEEKNRKVESLGNSQYPGVHVLQNFNKAFIRDYGHQGTYKYIDSLNQNTFNEIISSSLDLAHSSTGNKLKDIRYAEYLNFIFSYINDNKNLGVEDSSISMFIAYTNFPEILCMACLALKNKRLLSDFKKFRLFETLDFNVGEYEVIFAMLHRKLREL